MLPPERIEPRLRRGGRRVAFLAAASLLVAHGCSGGEPAPATRADAGAGPPRVGGAATSAAGRYRIEVRRADANASLGVMHDWIVRVEHPDGTPARPVRVLFDGGMPAHGHGFVTSPRVTRALGDGEFLVEGVKFHMAGDWELRVAVADADGGDTASFQIDVAP